MVLAKQAKFIEKLVVDNSPTILTAIGVAGAVATAVLTGKASFKAAEIIREYEWEPLAADRKEGTTVERAKLVWKLYIPPVTAGAATVAAIICANRISMSRAAALAAAYSLADKRSDEYKNKVKEKLGIKKEGEIKDEVAQDRVNRNPMSQQTIIFGQGDVPCFDEPTGRYFMNSMEGIRKAENNINRQINTTGQSTLRDLYEELDLPPVPMCDEIGWTRDEPLDIVFSTAMTDDSKPCITIEYQSYPIRGFK